MYHSVHALQTVLSGLSSSVSSLQAQQAQVLRELKDTDALVSNFIRNNSAQSPTTTSANLPECLSESDVRSIVRSEVQRADDLAKTREAALLAQVMKTIEDEINAVTLTTMSALAEMHKSLDAKLTATNRMSNVSHVDIGDHVVVVDPIATVTESCDEHVTGNAGDAAPTSVLVVTDSSMTIPPTTVATTKKATRNRQKKSIQI